VSPILVRPVREQLEHDRVIRQLQKDLTRRKVEVAINPGAEQNVGLGMGTRKEFPDVILFATDKGRKVLAVIEVETGESVNHLEAMAEWAHYSRLKAPLHLYVPMGSVDVARRLAADNNIQLSEVFSYHQVGDLVRFASVYRTGPAFRLPEDPPAPPEASVKKDTKDIKSAIAKPVKPVAVPPTPKPAPPPKPAPSPKPTKITAAVSKKASPAKKVATTAKPVVKTGKPTPSKSVQKPVKSAARPAARKVAAKKVGKRK
jgi:hypothetical protein